MFLGHFIECLDCSNINFVKRRKKDYQCNATDLILKIYMIERTLNIHYINVVLMSYCKSRYVTKTWTWVKFRTKQKYLVIIIFSQYKL